MSTSLEIDRLRKYARRLWREKELARHFFRLAAAIDDASDVGLPLSDFFEDAVQAAVDMDTQEAERFPISLFVIGHLLASLEVDESRLEDTIRKQGTELARDLHSAAMEKLRLTVTQSSVSAVVSNAVALIIQFGNPEADLGCLKDVRQVNLSNQPFGPRHNEVMRALIGVVDLNLSGTFFTGTSLSFLRDLQSLETLSLARVPLRSPDLFYLQEAKHLKNLDLSGSRLDDLAVGYLACMPQLTSITLSRTSISEESVEHLRQEMPNCRVIA